MGRRALALIAVAVTIAACGGGAPVDEARLPLLCDAAPAAEAVHAELTEDAFGGPPAAERAAELSATLGPLVREVAANATGGATDAIEAQSALRLAAATTGAMVARSAEALDEEAEVGRFLADNCVTDDRVDLIAIDYEYNAVPREVRAGRVAWSIDNRGREYHEAIVIRLTEDAPPIAELVGLPPAERGAAGQVVARFVAGPGDRAAVVLDLDPGRYAVACLLPIGATTAEAVDGDARRVEGPGRHLARGMRDELVVR